MKTPTRTLLSLVLGITLSGSTWAQDDKNVQVEGVPEVGEAVVFFKTGDVTKGKRLFHLDGYYPDGSHSTFGFFGGNPGYDVIKPKVADILKKKLKPVSRMIPEDGGATIELNE